MVPGLAQPNNKIEEKNIDDSILAESEKNQCQ